MTSGADKRNDANIQAMREINMATMGKFDVILEQGCAKLRSQFVQASKFCGA